MTEAIATEMTSFKAGDRTRYTRPSRTRHSCWPQEHSAQFGEAVNGIVERSEDGFAVSDRECQDSTFRVVGVLEVSAVSANPASRRFLASSSTSRSAIGMPASLTEAIIRSIGAEGSRRRMPKPNEPGRPLASPVSLPSWGDG